jgi:hypothetical protein
MERSKLRVIKSSKGKLKVFKVRGGYFKKGKSSRKFYEIFPILLVSAVRYAPFH